MIQARVEEAKESKELNIMLILKNAIEKIRKEQDKLINLAL